MVSHSPEERVLPPIFLPLRDGRYPDIPYKGLAWIYDRVLGDAMFPLIRRTFEQAVEKYHIRFASAADIGCGTGTFLRYLSRKNVQLFGVDRSPDMLRIAEEKNRGTGVIFLQQDLTQLHLPQPVDLITCNCDTLNYILSAQSLRQVIARCHSNLRTAGYFLYDIIVGSNDGVGWRTTVQKIRMPNLVSHWVVSWNPQQNLSIVRMDHLLMSKYGGYRRFAEIHKQRWYPFPQMNSLLHAGRFKVRGIHDARTFLPATETTSWAKYVAQKN
jgi:SAM-dependent methyltransferase